MPSLEPMQGVQTLLPLISIHAASLENLMPAKSSLGCGAMDALTRRKFPRIGGPDAPGMSAGRSQATD
jgi:hypothetical protein